MKKAIAVFLLLALLATLFCACKKQEPQTTTETSEPISDEPAPAPSKTVSDGVGEKDEHWTFWYDGNGIPDVSDD